MPDYETLNHDSLIEDEPKKVLLLEQDPEIITLLTFSLGRRGLQTSVVNTHEQALKLCSDETWDLIIASTSPPHSEGLKLLERIDPKNSNNPSIIFLGDFEDITVEEALNLGATALIYKNMKISNLVQCLIKLAPKRRARLSGRIHFRDNIQLPVIISGSNFKETHLLSNISKGGMYIELSSPNIQPQQHIHFEIVCDEATVLKGEGLVRWIRAPKAPHSLGTPGLISGCGIEFLTFHEQSKENLLNLLNNIRTGIKT